MQGLILAGGFATRLRPLSCSKPKLLFPLVGIPLIDHMVNWFKDGGVRRVVLAVNHLSDKLKIEVGERRLGSEIIFSVEESPLGTGGPIRLARKVLDHKEPFIVANGDIVSDIDLSSVLRLHRESGAVATVALVSVREPRAFGSAALDSKGRIVRFEEKSKTSAGRGWINAGIYVLNPSVIDMIPSKRHVSLEREVFPKLARSLKMQGWKHRGFWYDIGKIPDYVRANRELLRKPGFDTYKRRGQTVAGVRIIQPTHIGRGSILEKEASLGPYAILSESVKVDTGARVRDSIIFEETVIGENCVVEGSIVGERVNVGRETRIGKGSIVAGEIMIEEGTVIEQNSLVLN